MNQTIEHDASRHRFTTSVQNHLCVLDYSLDESVMTITHTGVPAAVGGQGIAAALTRVALDTARQNNWRVVPRCSYAAIYIERHPEYRELVR